MSKQPQTMPVRCLVTEYRNQADLTQEALAAACGLTRQAISQIEAGSYFPNSIAALRIARALGCKVEDLFQIEDDDPVRKVTLVKAAGGDTAGRIHVVKVRDRWIGHPLVPGHDMLNGFAPAGGLLEPQARAGKARLLLPPEQLERTALLAGCDPGLSILSSHMERRSRDARLLWLSASSQAALDAVRRGEAHLAGTHLPELDAGANLRQARRALGRRGGLVVAFASWEQGLMVAHGNPKNIGTVADLARPGVRMINREPGSGSRVLLDHWLAKARVPRKKVAGYTALTHSHMSVAHTVRFGGADVGVGLRATAHSCGLDFIPLEEVRFDFVIPRDVLSHPAVALLLDLLQSRRLRAELGILPGYEVSCMGRVIADLG